eukprot:4094509-Prymnesium_polylepis.1
MYCWQDSMTDAVAECADLSQAACVIERLVARLEAPRRYGGRRGWSDPSEKGKAVHGKLRLRALKPSSSTESR